MNGMSPWAISASAELIDAEQSIFDFSLSNFGFSVHHTQDSVWVVVDSAQEGRISFRAAFGAGSAIQILEQVAIRNGIDLTLGCVFGRLNTRIWVEENEYPVLRYTTAITPDKELFIPYWPRDIVFMNNEGNAEETEGTIHAQQWGTRSGFLYLSMLKPASASVFYLQNLTALSDYCEQTETTVGDSVGGTWPELGFALPTAISKPLQPDATIVISDALVAFAPGVPKDEPEMITRYLNMLGCLYLLMPKSDTHFTAWPDVLKKGLEDLIDSPGCWTQVGGNHYFNAYISDYNTPPEIMVQLAVLLPLIDYVEWSGKDIEIIKTIKEGLPAFYDEKLGTINRWLPAAVGKLKGEEEQKAPGVMDSWYLHHPLLNLSRLALKGDKDSEKLFLDSLGFAIKVAHHFKYQWPVFYKMDTLEVLKAETVEGKGGEKDVAGIYAHVMLQAWELTKEQRYLNEAEKAAQTLQGMGFEVFYQANNTAFAAGALLRLYKITGKKMYLDLSYMCLAGIFRNVQLWDCNYGYGKNFPRFFALYPLNDAPYTAAYEEQEVFCAMHDYLKHAEGIDLSPAVRMLIAEYIRYVVDRAVYYYPTMLPKEMLEETPKVGEVDPQLWIALEDLQDGWLKSGTVGQEVYGAGNAFGILPRHYLRVPDEDFLVYVDYPTSAYNARKGKNIHFEIIGDERIQCRMMIIKTSSSKLPEFTITTDLSKDLLNASNETGGNQSYLLPGNCKVHIAWKKN